MSQLEKHETITPPVLPQPMNAVGRHLVLWTAFLGWAFAGTQMGTFPLIIRSAMIDFLGETEGKAQTGLWYGLVGAAFLLGAALGGLIFGWMGDLVGRVRTMGLSILWYSGFTGISYFAPDEYTLLVLRFVAAMGVGGMWPTGVALCSEAWSDVSRPMLAGLIGTAANVGTSAIAIVGIYVQTTPGDWRWVLAAAATPMFLGLFVLAFVPESPKWLLTRDAARAGKAHTPLRVVFTPPLLKYTIIGILLGTIPLLGGWGSGGWLIPWAEQVHGSGAPAKAITQLARSGGACVGALFGGWLAMMLGRRTTFFVICLASFGISEYIYGRLTPSDENLFYGWVVVLGMVSTVLFGWLPLYLPELFPTEARATGAGITFNFGRIISAFGVTATGWVALQFENDYGRVGLYTSTIYAIGLIIILFAPDTSHKKVGAE